MSPAEHPIERVELLLELGRVDAAVRAARVLVSADPGDPNALTVLARACLAGDDVAGAEQAAAAALAIAPESIAARAASLRAAMARDVRGVRAVRRWRRTVSERADLLAPAATVDAGMAYLVSRGFAAALRTKDARAAAETARRLAPDQVWGSLALAQLACDRRRPGEARKHVADVLRLEPDNRWAHEVGAQVGLGAVRQLEHLRTGARAGDERAAAVAHGNAAALSGQLLPVIGTLIAAWVGWVVALETSRALAGLVTFGAGAVGIRILTTRLRRNILRGLGSAGRAIVVRSSRAGLPKAIVGTLLAAAVALLLGWPVDRESAIPTAARWAEDRAEDDRAASTGGDAPEADATAATSDTGGEPLVTEALIATALAGRGYFVGLAALLVLVAGSLPVDAWLMSRPRPPTHPGARST